VGSSRVVESRRPAWTWGVVSTKRQLRSPCASFAEPTLRNTGLDYCTVYDAVELRRCFNCCGFHHFSKQCHVTVPTCPKCAGAHSVKSCTNEKLKCTNFVQLNAHLKEQNPVDHAAWDLSNCNAYKKAVSDFKRDILSIQ
jgi:hypothetical protein